MRGPPSRRRSLWTLLPFALPLALLVPLLASAGDETPLDYHRLRSAVERGLGVVQKAAASYPEHRSCFSCHHQTLPVLAMVSAREKGMAIAPDLLRRQAEFTRDSFDERDAMLRKGEGVGGASMTVGYGLWTLDLARWKPDTTTEAMVEFLLANQRPDGSWVRSAERPPLEESNVTWTILSVYYMGKFAASTQAEAVERATARARTWVLAAAPVSHEDHVSRLGALALLAADRTSIEEERRRILDAQRADGSWAQLPGMEGDAYATRSTLFTLQRVGLSPADPVYVRGLRFLLATQRDDGSWYVKSRSKPVQSFFDNSDPHGKDQFISVAATSWATTAIAIALPRRLRI